MLKERYLYAYIYTHNSWTKAGNADTWKGRNYHKSAKIQIQWNVC